MLSAKSAPLAATPSGRLSYARIAEVRDGVSVDKFEVPNLIELQLESFQWFIEKGLRDLFDEISPIKDFTGKVMELQFLDYEFGAPKYSEEECRTKDLTFSRPLYVNVELLIKETGEIQRQRVYMGDYPWMTDSARSWSTGRSASSCRSSCAPRVSTTASSRIRGRAGCCSATRSSRT